MHIVDLIRKKRDGIELLAPEIDFIVRGAADESLPTEQLAAWLMATWIRGLSSRELQALTRAMRFSGEVFDSSTLGKRAVDKHSTGGVGDKTSFLVAPIAAAAGLAVPMISGRALGHTGGTLDKLESIPGYRTQLSLEDFRSVLEQAGASIVGQTKNLVPADRVLYALRDRTGTVESPYLICASIMSKKLAAGLNALVLDVKTGSGAFLKSRQDGLRLAALMVQTGEAAGTRTAALLTEMGQPLGRMAGNWVEIWESVELLKNERDPLDEDLRELSLILAGWMIYLGGQADSAAMGYIKAEQLLTNGAAYAAFRNMVEAHGGDATLFDNPAAFHKPNAQRELTADRTGYLVSMNNEQVGWAVQRLGAGRIHAGEPVNAHAGITLHRKIGSLVKAGDSLCTMYAASMGQLDEPERLLHEAIRIADAPGISPPLIHEIVDSANAAQFL